MQEPTKACASPEPVAETPLDAAASPAVALDVSVPVLLAQSREHAKSRSRFANRQRGSHHAPDYAQAMEQARLALETRELAHQLDPDHHDPAWALDTTPHAVLCDFFRRYLVTP